MSSTLDHDEIVETQRAPTNMRDAVSTAAALLATRVCAVQSALFQRVTPRQMRVTLGVFVAALHLLFIWVLVFGLRIAPAPPSGAEIILTLNTEDPFRGVKAPKITPVSLPIVQIPAIEVENADAPAAVALTGSVGATIPAQAIGETHSVPPLNETLFVLAHKTPPRLRLSVAADGSISDAVVDSSSGSDAVDSLAIAWVKAHWRYKPAFREGVPIAVVTTAVVPF